MEQRHHVPDDEPRPGDHRHAVDEVPIGGSELEQITAYLRIAFADADSSGEKITSDDAQVIATLLAPLLDPEAEMARFATTGDADPKRLHLECQRLTEPTERLDKAIDTRIWIQRLEQYVSHEKARDG